MRVQDVMTPNVEFCTPGTDIAYVARKMVSADCGALPVVQDAESMKPVGIVTDRDIVVRLVAKGQNPVEMRAEQAMSADLATIRADADIRQCLDLMEERKVRRLPVVDAQGRCVGIVAQADIADRLRPAQAGAMLREISEAGQTEGQGKYH